MEKSESKSNLSDIRIYDLLKIKNPRSFHLKESVKNILKSMELVEVARRDLLSTPFTKNKKTNTAIVQEVERQLDNVCWNLLALGESISKLQTIKQNCGILTDNALNELLDGLQGGGEDII